MYSNKKILFHGFAMGVTKGIAQTSYYVLVAETRARLSGHSLYTQGRHPTQHNYKFVRHGSTC